MKRLNSKSKARLRTAIDELMQVSGELAESRPYGAWMIHSVARALSDLMDKRWDVFEMALPPDSDASIRSLMPGKPTVRWSGSGTLYVEERSAETGHRSRDVIPQRK